MGKTASGAKRKWEESHTQVKVTVPSDLASSFKAKCSNSGESITAALSRLMAEYCGTSVRSEPVRQGDYSTLRKRRTAAREVAAVLEQFKLAEEALIGKAPENLNGAPVYEAAAERASALEDIIEQLGEHY